MGGVAEIAGRVGGGSGTAGGSGGPDTGGFTLPGFFDDLLRGGLPAVLDIPVAAQPRTSGEDVFTERNGPQDTSARSTVRGTDGQLSLQNMILLGTAGIVAVLGIAALATRG